MTIILLVPTSVTAAEPVVDSLAMDRVVAAARKEWVAPGLALVVVQNDKVVHLKGYGVRAAGKPELVTADTLFPLASCTKAFTSTMLAVLADEEQIAWDDPVGKHLPTYHLSDPNADKLVTMRDLLTHRTGIAGHDLLWYRAPWDRNEVLRRIPKLPLTAPFRGGYQYTSLMYIAAGEAAANRTRTPWEELISEKLCTPLAMKGVAFTSAEFAKRTDRAEGHRLTDGKIEAMPAYEMSANPAGSMFATARGLGAWLRLQLNEGQFAGKRIVSAANLAETKQPHIPMRRIGTEMLTTYPDTTQVSYAMGWVVYDYRGKLVVAHGGMIDGFRVQVTLLPNEKIGFVLLNNLHETKMNLALGNTLIDQFLGLPTKDWHAHFKKAEADAAAEKLAEKEKQSKARKADVKPTLALDKYVGEYTDSAYGLGKVTLTDGKLMWSWSSFKCPLEHWSGDNFRVTSGFFTDDLVEFRATADGVTALTIRGVLYAKK